MRIVRKPNYAKRIAWAVIIAALIIYSIVVGGWICEGNRHFERERQNAVINKAL